MVRMYDVAWLFIVNIVSTVGHGYEKRTKHKKNQTYEPVGYERACEVHLERKHVNLTLLGAGQKT